jgi:hypothetical protein
MNVRYRVKLSQTERCELTALGAPMPLLWTDPDMTAPNRGRSVRDRTLSATDLADDGGLAHPAARERHFRIARPAQCRLNPSLESRNRCNETA